ncbi:hypothetical protein [Enterococcus sp. LJL90]
MNLQDQEFNKLIKQSRKKNFWRTLGITLGVLIVVVILPALFFLQRYNYPPFGEHQISGLQDNHARVQEGDLGVASLLFNQSYDIQFNTDAKRISFFIETYDHGELSYSEQVFHGVPDMNGVLSGTMKFGILRDAQTLLMNLQVGGATMNFEKQFSELGFATDDQLATMWYLEEGPLELDQKYYFFYGNNTDHMQGGGAESFQENLQDETIPLGIVFYFILE